MPDTKFNLVVEDDPILKNLLGHTFAGKYQTLYASNGAEALALFAQYTPAVVLLDLMLPDIDGFSVLQQIRSRTDASKDVPVIIVSNLGQQTDKDRAMALGANDYIVKAEVEIEEIMKRIEKVAGPAQLSVLPATAPTAMPLVDADPTLLHVSSGDALLQAVAANPVPQAPLPSVPAQETAPETGTAESAANPEGTQERPFII